MSAIRRMAAVVLSLMLLGLPARAATGVRYSTDAVELGTFKRTTTLNGEVQYLETQGFFVYQPNARLGEILVAQGDIVLAGQPVVTYTASVSGTVEKQAENDLNEAKDDYEYELGARTQEIDQLRAQLAAEADETAARILELKIERAELTLSRYRADAEANVAGLTQAYEAAQAADEPKTLSAGITGVAYSVARETPGEAIDASKMLVALANPLKVLVRVDNSAGELKYGMPVDLKLSGGQNQASAKGVVVSADNVLPSELRTGAAIIAYDASKSPGQFSAVVTAVTMQVENALIADPDAVSYDQGRNFVRILGADGTVHTRYVVKAMEAGSGAWIALGLSEGDKLITK